MNTLAVYVTKIIKGPERVVTDTTLGFKVTVLASDGYGSPFKKVLWFHTLGSAKKVEKGTYLGEH